MNLFGVAEAPPLISETFGMAKLVKLVKLDKLNSKVIFRRHAS